MNDRQDILGVRTMCAHLNQMSWKEKCVQMRRKKPTREKKLWKAVNIWFGLVSTSWHSYKIKKKSDYQQ